MRYRVHRIRSADYTIDDLVHVPFCGFNELSEAQDFAQNDPKVAKVMHGVAIVDTERATIDWGNWVTDYRGNALEAERCPGQSHRGYRGGTVL
jgi:hypothetical protein